MRHRFLTRGPRSAPGRALALGAATWLCLTAAAASAAEQPDLIFKKSTVFKLLTPNDKLATYAIDDPEVEGVACHFTVPERGGISGWLGVAEEVTAGCASRDVCLCTLLSIPKLGLKLGPGRIAEMSRGIHKLSPAKVRTAKVGRHADGGNLYLDVEPGAHGLTRKWLFRYAVAGRERDMGLGPTHTIGLSEARERARAARQQLFDGIDPIEARNAAIREQQLATLKTKTFREVAREYIDDHDAEWRSAKHRREWGDTLNRFVHPILGDLPVQSITVDLVLRTLKPIWETKTETASRLRGRIEMVLDFAKAKQLREGDNPASWDVLQHLLPQPSKVQPKKHHEALPYAEIGTFMAKLRKHDDVLSRALNSSF